MEALCRALERARGDAARRRAAVGIVAVAAVASGAYGYQGFVGGGDTAGVTCPGACAPGAFEPCGACGSRTCGADCRWSACAGEGPCLPGTTRPCVGGCAHEVCSAACTWCGCPTVGCDACEGSAAEWSGCRGNGCSVCGELVDEYPCYFANHPDCAVNLSCASKYYSCSAKCPAPTEADACACTADADGWAGCRGTGCSVCAEKVAGYACYALNHPACRIDVSCNAAYSACASAICPPPTDADRGSRQ
jgi:hypothetical protein